jgi:hypothetical protein
VIAAGGEEHITQQVGAPRAGRRTAGGLRRERHDGPRQSGLKHLLEIVFIAQVAAVPGPIWPRSFPAGNGRQPILPPWGSGQAASTWPADKSMCRSRGFLPPHRG